MRTLKLTPAKAAVAGLLTLGLILTGAPAFAIPVEQPRVVVTNTAFTAGSWGAGVEVTFSDVPSNAIDVWIQVGEGHGGYGGPIATAKPSPEADGTTYKAVILPDTRPVAPDSYGLPTYNVVASYMLPEGVERIYVPGNVLTVTAAEVVPEVAPTKPERVEAAA